MGKRTKQCFVTQKSDGSWYSNMRTPAVHDAEGNETVPSAPTIEAAKKVRKIILSKGQQS